MLWGDISSFLIVQGQRITENSCFVESVIVLPSKDLLLEVHRGLTGHPIYVERQVISASEISAVIINEGLRGWNVRYYLAVLTQVDKTQSLYVLYEVKRTFSLIGVC